MEKGKEKVLGVKEKEKARGMRLPNGGKDKEPEKAEAGAKETGKEKKRKEEDGKITRA